MTTTETVTVEQDDLATLLGAAMRYVGPYVGHRPRHYYEGSENEWTEGLEDEWAERVGTMMAKYGPEAGWGSGSPEDAQDDLRGASDKGYHPDYEQWLRLRAGEIDGPGMLVFREEWGFLFWAPGLSWIVERWPGRVENWLPLPRGQVLVHNHVRPARRQGTRGFRFWAQQPRADLEPCSCKWAGADLGGLDHFRVALARDDA